MAIIIGDIHGDMEMARAFLNYRPNERHIALGDLVDGSKFIQDLKGIAMPDLEEEQACLELLLDSSTEPLWGNHDLAYLPERPWPVYGRFGEAFRERYHTYRDRFQAALAVDGWLLTHAGVSPRLSRIIPAEVLEGGVERIADWLNDEFAKQLSVPDPQIIRGQRFGYGPIFNRAICRSGHNEFGGIFWFDADGEQSQPAPGVGRQIFGHSPVERPERGHSYWLNGEQGPEHINLNAVGGGIWIYDTLTDEFVDLTWEKK